MGRGERFRGPDLDGARAPREKVAENVRQLLTISENAQADPVDAAHFLAYERIFAS